jgi:cytochrome c553
VSPTAEQQTRLPDKETMRPQPLAACFVLAFALTTGAALAEPPSDPPAAPAPAPAAAAPAAPVGNPEAGRTLAYTCQGCHGITGYKNAYPSYRVPKIGGQSAQYLSQALTEYREGKRKHPTMQAQSMSFSAQEIADLATYLSTVK